MVDHDLRAKVSVQQATCDRVKKGILEDYNGDALALSRWLSELQDCIVEAPKPLLGMKCVIVPKEIWGRVHSLSLQLANHYALDQFRENLEEKDGQ